MIETRQRGVGTDGDIASKAVGMTNLRLRVASALVLAPLTLACAFVGGWLFLALCFIASGVILCEWTRLVAGRLEATVLAPGLASLGAALALTGLDRPTVAAALIAIGVILAGAATALPSRDVPPSSRAAWAAGGMIYAGAAFLGPALLRRDSELGLVAVFFLAATVWATDIFAYFVGRAVGGPLLWPRMSPNKTWAGAAGGLAGGTLAGISVAYASGLLALNVIGVVAAVLSVLAQCGDLLESAVKRRFGAKDASHLIPGHGGLMDRLDGFIVAAFAALLIGTLRQGLDAPAQGLLIW